MALACLSSWPQVGTRDDNGHGNGNGLRRWQWPWLWPQVGTHAILKDRMWAVWGDLLFGGNDGLNLHI